VLAWELNPLFRADGDFVFTIKASRSGTGDWNTVGTVVNQYAFEDDQRWVYGKAPRLHYMVTVESGGTVYESEIKQIGGNLSTRDASILREIVRKETLRLQTQAGICGLLYKRRRWGDPCTSCIDYDTGEVTNSECSTCYATGFVGGYFDPVEYWVSELQQAPTRRMTTNDTRGVVEDRTIFVRALNCPWLDTGDVWLNFQDDRRYFVQMVREMEYRGVVFAFDQVELRLAPTTDVIYTLPRPDDVSSSSST